MNLRWAWAVVPLGALFFSYRSIVGAPENLNAERGDTFFMGLIGAALLVSIWNMLGKRVD